MYGMIRKMVSVSMALFGLSFVTTASAAPLVAIGVPLQVMAQAPGGLFGPVNSYWVPGFVRYDVYGNAVHVAGHWAYRPTPVRRVVVTHNHGHAVHKRVVTRRVVSRGRR